MPQHDTRMGEVATVGTGLYSELSVTRGGAITSVGTNEALPPGIGLVLCPCFGFGTPPLGLASLQVALRDAGYRTVPFDLDFVLLAEEPATINALFSAYYIGHPSGLDRVQFILRPTLTLRALFPEAFEAAPEAALAADLATVAAVDIFLSRWADTILAHGVRVVMASVYVSNLLPTLLLARRLRALDPDLQFVVGGPGVAAPEIQDFVLRVGGVDVCGTGEGERLAPQLAERLLAGVAPDVPGATFLRSGEVVRNPTAPLMPLEALRMPDYTGLPVPGHTVHHYRSNPNLSSRWFGVALPVATTRGCVMRCTFCSETNYWERFRQREPGAVVAELEALQARWGVRQFTFGDSLLNGNPRWLEAFADRCIEAELDASFVFAYFRPTKLPRPLLIKLHQAGFRLFSFGLETASQALLDGLVKGTKVPEVEEIVLDALEVGICVNISILCGMPGETIEQVMESVRFVQGLQDTVTERIGPEGEAGLTVHAGWPLRVEPASRMFLQPERYGLTLEPTAPELPPALTHLHDVVAPLLVRWVGSVGLDEIGVRARLLKDTINREPRTVFESDALASWLDDDSVVSPVRPATVLGGTDGRFFLATDHGVLARIDGLTGFVWPYITRGESLGQIRAALIEAYPDGGHEASLPQVFSLLLANRLVYPNDFHPRRTALSETL